MIQHINELYTKGAIWKGMRKKNLEHTENYLQTSLNKLFSSKYSKCKRIKCTN